MRLNKTEISELLGFVQDGYLTRDIYFLNTYLTIRSLTKQDRQLVHLKFKYLDKKYNLNLVLEILSKVIYRIGGIEIREELVRKKLKVMSSVIVMGIYEEYSKTETYFDELLNKMESFVKTSESRNLWNVYKTNIRLEKLNEYQYFWALLNLNKDKLEFYKFEWSKVEYMTNSICAFLNPKEFKRLKNQMNISSQFDEEQDDNEPFEVEEQEVNEKGIIDLAKTTMNQMVKKKEETQQEYYERVSSTLVEINKGKVMDEHDRIVRDYEIDILKKMLYQRRLKSEISTELRKTRDLAIADDMNTTLSLGKDGIYHDQATVIGSDDIDARLAKEIEKDGFCYNGNSYADAVNDKFFAAIPQDEKIAAFNEVMSWQINIKAEVCAYLDKNVTKEEKEYYQQILDKKPMDTITKPIEVVRSDSSDIPVKSDDTFKQEIYFEETEEEMIKKESAAYKAARMQIDTKKDAKIVKNVSDKKITKLNLDDDNLDQMIIK